MPKKLNDGGALQILDSELLMSHHQRLTHPLRKMALLIEIPSQDHHFSLGERAGPLLANT